MTVAPQDRRTLVFIALIAGIVQALAGVTMYLTGVYFAPWSMLVSLAVLLGCIIAGIRWFTFHRLQGAITYGQAVGVGSAIALGTGIIYAAYNFVSITWFYPDFLGQVDRILQAQGAADPHVTIGAIALPNLVRLTLFGTLLSVISGAFLRRRP